MKVYFGANYYGHPKYARAMQEIRLDRELAWGELSGFLPAAYVSGKGIALDFCMRIPHEAVRAFWEKWQAVLEGEQENGLSPEQEEQIREENPMHLDFQVELSVNGQKLERAMSCGTSDSKVLRELAGSTAGEEAYERGSGAAGKVDAVEVLKQAYGCGEESGWCFKRFMFRWKKRPAKVEQLEIRLVAGSRSYACGTVETDSASAGKIFELVHPLTGEQFQLEVKDLEAGQIPQEVLEGMESRWGRMELPSHYMTLSYTISPALSPTEFWLGDESGGDKPRKLPSDPAAGAGKEDHSGVSAIGIIGGANGPTALFLAGKWGQEVRRSMSSTHFEPVEMVSWKPVFLVKEREDLILYEDGKRFEK